MELRRRVLVVDADAEVRLQVDRQLEELGWDALTVNNGAEAIRVVELGMPVHVMLTEVRLPDLEGHAAAWLVARMLPRVRVVFMSEAPPGERLDPPDAPCLQKPFSTLRLAKALEEAAGYPR